MTTSPKDNVDGTFDGAIDTDTPLQAAAREAGWALTTLVDISDWQRRDQISDIIGRLAVALIDSDTPKTQMVPSPADQIIGQIEELFPNWLAYRDLVDCITCELHELRKRAEGIAE